MSLFQAITSGGEGYEYRPEPINLKNRGKLDKHQSSLDMCGIIENGLVFTQIFYSVLSVTGSSRG